jgi:hypothetical protein
MPQRPATQSVPRVAAAAEPAEPRPVRLSDGEVRTGFNHQK